MNHGWIYRDRVGKAAAGQTILQYYCQRYRHSTQEKWRERIATGQILLDETSTTPDTKLELGQKLAYHRPPWQEPPVPLTYRILYEDEDLLAIAKPSGLPVLPGGGFLEHTFWWLLQQQYPQDTPVPVHRLGRGTSGLLLLARSPLAKSNLSHQFRSNSLTKVYLALVGGNTMPQSLTICDRIGKIPHPSLGYVYGATSQGKPALSECRVLSRWRDRTLVEVTILTGRPHQIRIHLAAVGFPLLGDPLYLPGGIPRIVSETVTDANIPVPGDCGYYLHAYRFSFTHPRTGKRMTLEATPPLKLKVK